MDTYNQNENLFEVVSSSTTHALGTIFGQMADWARQNVYALVPSIISNNFVILDIGFYGWNVQYIDDINQVILNASYNTKTNEFSYVLIKEEDVADVRDNLRQFFLNVDWRWWMILWIIVGICVICCICVHLIKWFRDAWLCCQLCCSSYIIQCIERCYTLICHRNNETENVVDDVVTTEDTNNNNNNNHN